MVFCYFSDLRESGEHEDVDRRAGVAGMFNPFFKEIDFLLLLQMSLL